MLQKNKISENHVNEKDNIPIKRQREQSSNNNNNNNNNQQEPSPKKSKTITVNKIIINNEMNDVKEKQRQKSMKQAFDALEQKRKQEQQQLQQQQQLSSQINNLHTNKIVSYKGSKDNNLSLSDLENKIKASTTSLVYEDKLNNISPSNISKQQQQPVKKVVNDVFGNVIRKSKEKVYSFLYYNIVGRKVK